jgi:hypothetical protein
MATIAIPAGGIGMEPSHTLLGNELPRSLLRGSSFWFLSSCLKAGIFNDR